MVIVLGPSLIGRAEDHPRHWEGSEVGALLEGHAAKGALKGDLSEN